MEMSKDEQIRIMEAQIAAFDTLLEKLAYLHEFFAPDPMFTKEARDVVISRLG
jgi:hypothetical protein